MATSSSLTEARQYGAGFAPLVLGLAEALKRHASNKAEPAAQQTEDPHEVMRQFWLLAVLFRYNIQQGTTWTRPVHEAVSVIARLSPVLINPHAKQYFGYAYKGPGSSP